MLYTSGCEAVETLFTVSVMLPIHPSVVVVWFNSFTVVECKVSVGCDDKEAGDSVVIDPCERNNELILINTNKVKQ